MKRKMRNSGAALAVVFAACGGLAHAQSTAPTLLANLDSLPLPTFPRLEADPPRSSSVRAYAVDGGSFYLEGQRVRVDGFDPAPTELARQRLQLALDGGEIEIDAIGEDDSGALIARVSVQGRDLLELLR